MRSFETVAFVSFFFFFFALLHAHSPVLVCLTLLDGVNWVETGCFGEQQESGPGEEGRPNRRFAQGEFEGFCFVFFIPSPMSVTHLHLMICFSLSFFFFFSKPG